ncbi:desumoylating isopeptidase 1 [Cucumis melo var. makuwa]|uniref:Desumoylating isopeptidase 1 n=1 Tax=Cucumis melo var. makuwa TaxID=1194695 RepID=A0A5A7SPI5_CUCMM|nr:desumoylating isopeptidase 1 [Cucumis melo var. makuwa]TYK21498.1 desumoylating isopeptidase 1 [Cucumis melo var. makuwa]
MAEEGHKVTLNVYDLSQGLARQLSTTFLGRPIEAIWHTGIVVYGNEYYFGGGIQHDPAGKTPYGKPMRSIDLGTTHVPKDVFEMYLEEISPRYTAETYSLLSHNCNNFSNEVAQFLVGATIPDYILDLPNIVMSSPMGAFILPMIQNLEATLKAGAVPMAPQFNPSSTNVPRSSSLVSNSSRTRSKPEVDHAKPFEKTTPAELQTSNAKGIADPLGDARSKVQEEIGREFAAIMATGTLRASEAAALATKKVMQKYGNATLSQG